MRYIRQEIFKEIGKKGQAKLRNSTIAIVGLGALGTVSAQLMARAGIGNLILIDRDIVELSNLQRQTLFDESDVGKPKALAAQEHLIKINSDVKINFFIDDLNCKNINGLIPTTDNSNKKIKNKKNADLILDCTDNLETRFLINDFSIKNNIPFIYSSAVGSKGYVFNVIPNKTPCLKCFLKEAAQLGTCETTGVLNTITNLISSIQADEAVKILLNNPYEKHLLFFDIWKNELLKIKVNKNKNCICCMKNDFEYLNGKKSSRIVKLCGNNIYQIKTKNIDAKQFNALENQRFSVPRNSKNFLELKNKLKRIGKLTDFGYCINFGSKLTVFNDGRVLVKAKDEKEAKSLYSKFIGN
ncbi:ThiF family adenylyltransferase [Candidatus Woesearchaeota archaeon]|nr:ThiF family adenylyltransferase [Candidatus Woesearchaeota archaeon]